MQLEDYFEILSPEDIRLKGTRIGIESVLYEYIHGAQAPEAIANHFPTLSLEQVYATILYYLQNREKVGAYLTEYLDYCRTAREEYEQELPAVIVRLRQLKAERDTTLQKAREVTAQVHQGELPQQSPKPRSPTASLS